ncbi:transposase [Streptomyces avidinii]|uniref:transposase n=1 Tax=Streptomyces avidinii TaxID=1895 RepID=UPI0037BB109A
MISDEAWAVLGPLFPAVKATGRPPVDRRTVVEATAWRFRTGAPWRDLPALRARGSYSVPASTGS